MYNFKVKSPYVKLKNIKEGRAHRKNLISIFQSLRLSKPAVVLLLEVWYFLYDTL